MTEKKPKYLVLADWIKDQIKTGELKPGYKLNSENELGAMFHMSRQTVRHAIDVLEKESVIVKKQGSGTYVNNLFPQKRNISTMNIAIISTYVDTYIFPPILNAMEKVISQAGYTIQIAFTHNDTEKERSVLQNLMQKNMIDGIIVETTKSGIPNPNIDIYKEIIKQKIPVIFFNSYYKELDLPHVSLDDREAGRIITEYLIQEGHEDIAGIFKSDDGQGHLRYIGYADALLKHGIKVRDDRVVWIDTEDMNHLHVIRKKLIKRLKDCTACVCYNDQVANALIPLLSRDGIRVPEDLSIGSIDNSELAELCEVPLTSAKHPMQLLGEKTAESLLSIIENPDFNGTYEFEPTIQVRSSVKKHIRNQTKKEEAADVEKKKL